MYVILFEPATNKLIISSVLDRSHEANELIDWLVKFKSRTNDISHAPTRYDRMRIIS